MIYLRGNVATCISTLHCKIQSESSKTYFVDPTNLLSAKAVITSPKTLTKLKISGIKLSNSLESHANLKKQENLKVFKQLFTSNSILLIMKKSIRQKRVRSIALV